MRRVVVTGIGLVTPLANGVDASWQKLLAGKSGIRKTSKVNVDDLPARVAGEVPMGKEPGQFDIDAVVPIKEQKKMDQFIHFAIGAAVEAVTDSGWLPEDEPSRERTGVLIGSGIGGLPKIEECVALMAEKGPSRISPFFIPAALINLASGHVSIRYGFKGPNHSVVTACSTGAHAIGDAARLIQHGDADVMIAGSSEACICRVGLAGFAACKALSTSYNDAPETASRPWDKGRDGFVMGEGAGMVVLEEYEHAKARGAKIYGEFAGYGLSGDAYHITAPSPEGSGGFRAMQAALKNAGMSVDKVDYINAHGTSTPLGDEIELGAVKRLFGDHAYKLSMSSTKSAIGHLLGGAGSVEAIFSLLAMRDQVAPPTLNLRDPSDGCDIDLVPLTAKQRKIDVVLSNSFGFGGTNASLVFKKARVISFKIADATDAPALADFARMMFCKTFTHYTPQALQEHLDEYYTAEAFADQLDDSDYVWMIGVQNCEIKAYMKYGKVALPVSGCDDALELCRLYVHTDLKGQGIGAALLQEAENAAQGANKKRLLLGVWENNFSAQKFYQKQGFHKIAEYDYLPIGDMIDREWIMEKKL